MSSEDSDEKFVQYLESLSGRRLDKRYRILGVMGHGRYGGVVSAAITSSGQNVAIKVARGDMSSLIHEAHVFSLLGKNKYTVDCFDLKPDLQETRYLVMSLEKQSLMEYMRSHPTITDGVAAIAAVDLIEGLKFLHSRGVVHRDINPGNILIPRTENKLRAIWTDFGFAGIKNGDDSWRCVYDTDDLTPNFFTPLFVRSGRAGKHVEMDDLWSMTYLILYMKRSSIIVKDNEKWQQVKKDLFENLEKTLPWSERAFIMTFHHIYYRGRNVGKRNLKECYYQSLEALMSIPGYHYRQPL